MIVLYNDITGDITIKIVEGTGDAEPGPGHSRIILSDCIGDETNVNQIPSFALRLCQENRKKEYPSISEQLDYIYHNGIDAWKTNIIDPIKQKYPKSS